MTTTRTSLVFSTLAPSLQEQLQTQGLDAPPAKLAEWQKAMDALNILRTQRLISPAEIMRGEKLLARRITSGVQQRQRP